MTARFVRAPCCSLRWLFKQADVTVALLCLYLVKLCLLVMHTVIYRLLSSSRACPSFGVDGTGPLTIL